MSFFYLKKNRKCDVLKLFFSTVKFYNFSATFLRASHKIRTQARMEKKSDQKRTSIVLMTLCDVILIIKMHPKRVQIFGLFECLFERTYFMEDKGRFL